MKVLVDMDGPLADFDAACWEWIDRMGLRPNIDGRHQQQHHYVTEHLRRADARRLRQKVDSPGWFRSLPVTEGARAGVDRLFEDGHDVWVCTKPLTANPTCLNDKHAWLVNHFPELSERLITAPDKSMIVGDVLFDDAPRGDWVDRAMWTPVIYPTTYNVDLPYERATWASLPSLLAALLWDEAP